jgi:multimeric flavodoxin WrbA
MSVNVLGISASPRVGASHVLVRAALMGSQAIGSTTQFVSLAGRSITPCDGCEPCMASGACVIDDDMTPIYDQLLWADVIIVGTPVYFGGPSALCKALMERVQGFGVHQKRLRLKIGGAIACGAGKNGGQETTLIAMNLWFHINDMLPVGITSPASQWGMTAQTGFDTQDVERDAFILRLSGGSLGVRQSAWLYGRKLATVGAIVCEGLRASSLDLPDGPYGLDAPPEFPPELLELKADQSDESH